MYAYIKGTVKEVNPKYIVVDNAGVGYLIITPNSYRYKLDGDVTVFVHHYVREDQDTLYGFLSREEKHLFIDLIGVSGIGPKSALSILASGEPDKIMYAIEVADVKYLTKFPGIGPKSAQQIILDLKGKLTKETLLTDEVEDEVKEALQSLGYSNREINKVLTKVDATLPIEQRVKQALGLLIK